MIACYGGTFDPVHNGHVAAAEAVLAKGRCRAVRLIPCRNPPHRPPPRAAASERLAMLELAVAGHPGLEVDDRELRRSGPSYTVDTLESIREEVGAQTALGWVIGSDALAQLTTWERWSRLLELAHLLVLDRPGVAVPESGQIAGLLRVHGCEDAAALQREPAGLIWHVRQRPLDVSATEIRASVAAGRPVAHLLPLPVWAYIKQQGLYDSVPDVDAENE